MRYAFMTFSVPELDWAALLARAAALGYEGVEPRVAGKPGHPSHAHGLELERTKAERRAMRRAAERAGVAVCCVATGCALADPATRDEQVKLARRYLDLAAEVGAPTMRVFGGRLPAGLARSRARQTLAGALRELGEAAGERGPVVVLETHDDWCDPAEVAEVMRLVDHPAVGVNWDVMHPVRLGLATMAESFAVLRPWIRHVHVHDGINSAELQFRPWGEGEYDLAAAFRALRAMGYAGFLSGEWIKCEGVINLGEELRRMRALEARVAAET